MVRAVVTSDPSKTGPKALIQAIEEAGYGAEIAGSKGKEEPWP